MNRCKTSQCNIIRIGVLLVAALLGAACSDRSVTGVDQVTESAAAALSITISPAIATLSPGQSLQLQVVLSATNGRSTPTWTSSNTSVARVSATGVVTAVAPGSAVISATLRGATGTSVITVQGAGQVVSSLSVTPASALLSPQQTQQLVATARDANGNVIVGATVTWSSSNTAVATVTAAGLVTAVAIGTATIMATSGGKGASSAITVQGSTPPPTNADIFADNFEMLNWSRAGAGWDADWHIEDISIVPAVGGRSGRVARFLYNAPAGLDDNVALTLNTRTLPNVNHLFVRGYMYLPDPGTTPRRLMQRKLIYLTSHTSPGYNLVLGVYGDGDGDGIPNWYLPGQIAGTSYAGWQGLSTAGLFNRWHYVELEVKLNTPGASDGYIRLWVDDPNTPALTLTNRNLRGNSANGFTELMLGQQLQGDANSLTEYRYWDDFAVSTRRIGPN